MLGRVGVGRYAIRLGGGLLEDLHGKDVRQTDFLSLWTSADRPQMTTAMESALRRGQAMVVEADGRTAAGQSVDFEILLAPMISHTGQVDRFLGLYQPTNSLSRLLGQPLDRFAVRQIRPLAQIQGAPAPAFPQLRLAALGGRRIA